jgi:hypothetical protein
MGPGERDPPGNSPNQAREVNIALQVPCACVCQPVANCRAASALSLPLFSLPSMRCVLGKRRGNATAAECCWYFRAACAHLLCSVRQNVVICFHTPSWHGGQRSGRPCASLTSPSSVPNAAERAAHTHTPLFPSHCISRPHKSQRYLLFCARVCRRPRDGELIAAGIRERLGKRARVWRLPGGRLCKRLITGVV